MKAFVLYLAAVAMLFGCYSNTSKKAAESAQETDLATDTAAPGNTNTITDFSIPTEEFSGMVDREQVTFAHKNYTRYRLTIGKQTTTGELNTERGYGPDRNATVFVLDFEKPEAEQKFFVRFSDGRFSMLDKERKEITGSAFRKL